MVGFHCLFPDSHKCSNLLESDFSYYFCKPTTLHIANRQIFERIKNNNTHTPKFKMGLFSPYLICFGWVFLVAVHSHTSQNSLFCHRLSTAQTRTEKNMNSQVLRCIQYCLITQINLASVARSSHYSQQQHIWENYRVVALEEQIRSHVSWAKAGNFCPMYWSISES